jgi:hypothetical protein
MGVKLLPTCCRVGCSGFFRALRAFKTTPLISIEDGIQALRDA